MSSVLLKAIAARYYKVNTGFFLLLFLLLFCLLDGKSTIALHYAIMRGITGSFAALFVALLVWGIYNYKCISFGVKEIHRPENSFLFSMQSVDNKSQLRVLQLCHAAMYLPLLAYAAIVVIIGFAEHHYLPACIFLAYQVLMCGIGAAVYFNQVNTTFTKPAIALPAMDISRKKKFLFYLVHHSLSSLKGSFIGIKLFSLLLLQALVAANADTLSKEAICVLIMFLISAHALLPLYYVRFIEGNMGFLRNMPIPVMRRMLVYVVTYAIIFLPELLFLLLNEHHVMPLQLTLSLYAVAVSQLSLYTSFQYLKSMQTERYSIFVFGLFFINILLLAAFNLWFLFIVEGVVATVMFVRLYDRYEYAKSGN